MKIRYNFNTLRHLVLRDLESSKNVFIQIDSEEELIEIHRRLNIREPMWQDYGDEDWRGNYVLRLEKEGSYIARAGYCSDNWYINSGDGPKITQEQIKTIKEYEDQLSS